MKLFFDSSVLIAACLASHGTSRLLFQIPRGDLEFLTCEYCKEEVQRNLPRFQPTALSEWAQISPSVKIVPNTLTIPYPLLFWAHKDKPVLCSALAEETNVLLTWDRADFGHLLGTQVYGMRIETPLDFLKSLL